MVINVGFAPPPPRRSPPPPQSSSTSFTHITGDRERGREGEGAVMVCSATVCQPGWCTAVQQCRGDGGSSVVVVPHGWLVGRPPTAAAAGEVSSSSFPPKKIEFLSLAHSFLHPSSSSSSSFTRPKIHFFKRYLRITQPLSNTLRPSLQTHRTQRFSCE